MQGAYAETPEQMLNFIHAKDPRTLSQRFTSAELVAKFNALKGNVVKPKPQPAVVPDKDVPPPIVSQPIFSGTENRGVSWILQMCSEAADCGVIKTAYKNASVINAGWMYLTSNPNRCKCAKELLSDARPKRIRIDICNSTCFPERGRTCQPHECFAGMRQAQAGEAILKNDPKTFARIDKAISMAQNDLKNFQGDLFVKSCLECSIDPKARAKLNSYIQSKFSNFSAARFVDNPINDSCTPGMICEKHGEPAGNPNLIADNDGLSYDGINQLGYWRKNKSSVMVLAWKGCNNGLKKCEKPPCSFIPPPNRKDYCGSSRDGVDFASATATGAINTPDPVNPVDLKGCKKMLKASDGVGNFVLKLGDGRNYGVFLSPLSISKTIFKSVNLMKNGKRVDGAKQQAGFRYGALYTHEPVGKQRRVYDFRGHPNSYPDNSVLHADDYCWVLEKPRFRVD